MQLRFNRYLFGIALILLCAVDWVVISLVLAGADIGYAMGAMIALMVVAMAPLFLMIRPPAVASLHGDTLRIGRGRAHAGDVLRISTAGKSLDVAVRARDEDGRWVGAYGERMLTLPLWRIYGGRKAAERFAAFVEVTRREVPPLPVEAASAPAPTPRRDGVDPDVRPPLDDRAGEPEPSARPAFGRKGL
jgi:hypothetical protein